MRYRNIALFWLCLAFSIVLGHNFVPHHHHDEEEEAAASGHHHDDDDENTTAHFFSHFAHDSYVSSTNRLNLVLQSNSLKKTIQQFDLPANRAFRIDHDGYIPQQPPDWGSEDYSSELSLRLPSRAPPIA